MNERVLQPYNLAPVVGQGAPRVASTTEVMYSTISRWKDPIVSLFAYNHGADWEQFDRSVEPMFKPIAGELMTVPTQAEFKEKQRLYLNDMADREAFSSSNWGAYILGTAAGEATNPLNWVPIARLKQGVSVGANAINFGLTSFGVTAAEEGLRAGTMPNWDATEAAFTIAASTALGSLFGAGVGAGSKLMADAFDSAHRRMGMHTQTILEMESFLKNEEILKAGAAVARSPRFAVHADEGLRNWSIALTNQIAGKEDALRRHASGQININPQKVRDDINLMVQERDSILDELNHRRLDQGLSQTEDPWGIASSFFDWVDIMPTPSKTISRFKLPPNATPEAKQALNNFKKSALLLSGDSALLYAGQKLGLTLPPSVNTKSALRQGDLISLETKLSKIWSEETNAPIIAPNTIRRTTGAGVTLDDWLNEVNIKRIKQDPNMTTNEIAAAQIMDEHFARIRDEAEMYDVIGSGSHVESKLFEARFALDEARAKLDNALNAKYPKQDIITYWDTRVKDLTDLVREREASLDYIKNSNIAPSGPSEPYFTRFYRTAKIAEDDRTTQVFRNEVRDWIRQNPYGFEYNNRSGMWEPRDLTGDLRAQDAYVEAIIRSILSEDEQLGMSSTLRSQRLPSRALRIPNSRIIDFIETDFREVTRRYTMRAGKKIEFAKAFGNKSYKEVADQLVDDLINNGVSLKEANELRKNLTILYQRVTSTTATNPNSLNNKSVQALKEFTSLNYLGGSGITTIGDIPKIIMDTSIKTMVKSLAGAFESKFVQQQIKKFRGVYAEGVELSLGVSQQQLIEDTGVQVASRGWQRVKDAGFILNGLGPMTVGMKHFTGVTAIHDFIEIANRIADGSASRFDLDFSVRHGLSIEMMKQIANAPVNVTERGLKTVDVEEWAAAGIPTDTITAWIGAVNNRVHNTIISSAPNTRFTYADGSIFIPISAARKIFPNAVEAPDFPGYFRYENAIMTMPFQFYNWSMGASTNILHSSAQGQIKSRYAGFAAMLGFGYLLASIRTPSWAWDDMDYDERFMAGFERSGIGSIYSDIALNSIRLGVQTGLNNPENDLVRLPFYGKDGFAEAATTILGAGSSTIKDFTDASTKMYQGDYAHALKEFYLMLPLTELFWLKEDSRAFIDYATGLRR